jgi:hypothetical protein
MAITNKSSFAFLVLAYNHQKYILEHLESIKYLVQKYADSIHVDLIVNDDFSKDQTRSLVDAWLDLHGHLFRHVTKIYNSKNLGTCGSVQNMLDHMVADRCKLTAGDDVYSFENIFELSKFDSEVAMASGRALYLFEDKLVLNKRSNYLITATHVIYQNDTLLHRLKHWSYINTPNLLYATKCLMHPAVRSYLKNFDIVEDWPLQIAIARQFPSRKFKLDNNIWVYYRRTIGSAYIVANKRFVEDKKNIYRDLINLEISWVERFRLRSRLFCFGFENKIIKNILNVDAYFFVVSLIININKIFNYKIQIDLNSHKEHYDQIKKNASKFLINAHV